MLTKQKIDFFNKMRDSGQVDAQTALNLLSNYLLGEDWYVTMPLNQERVNTEIVNAILNKYIGVVYRLDLRKYDFIFNNKDND